MKTAEVKTTETKTVQEKPVVKTEEKKTETRNFNNNRQQGDRPYNNNRPQGDRPYNNSLTVCYMCITDCIQKGCFTMVNVTHYTDNRKDM